MAAPNYGYEKRQKELAKKKKKEEKLREKAGLPKLVGGVVAEESHDAPETAAAKA